MSKLVIWEIINEFILMKIFVCDHSLFIAYILINLSWITY